MARVAVVKPLSGKLVYVDEADLEAAKEDGLKVATPQQVAEVKLEAEYGGALNQLGAGASGVASGLTLGLSDIALSELGGRERLAAYESLYPTERMAGTVAGAVLPALLSAGTSAPASGASLAARALAATPAALATRAGAGAAAGLGLAAAEGVASGVGRTALRLGVSSGIESAIQGAGFEAGKLAIDDKLTGESIGQIASAGLTQGAVGFGLGGGLGLLGGGARSVLARRQNVLSEVAPDGIRPSAWQTAQSRAQKFGAKLRGADPNFADEYAQRQAFREMGVDAKELLAEELAQPIPPRPKPGSVEVPETLAPEAFTVPEAARATDAAAEAEQMAARLSSAKDIEEAAAVELRSLNERSGKAGRKIRDEFDDFLVGEELADVATRSSSIKADVLIGGNVLPEQLAQQRLWGESMLLEFDDTIRKIVDDPLGYSQQPVKKLKAVAARAERQYYAALELPSGEQSRELYRLFDRDLKSDMGAITGRLKRGAMTPEARQTADALTDFYKSPQAGLEDVELWGEIANVQRQINPQISEAITRKAAFSGDWYETAIRRKNPADPWRGLPLSDPNKIEKAVREAVSPMGSTSERTLVEYIDHKRNYYGLLEKYGDFKGKPKLLDAVQGQAKRLDRILERFEEMKQLQREVNFENPGGTGFSRMADAVPGAGASALRGVANAILRPQFISGAFRSAEAVLAPSAARTVESLAGSQAKTVASSASKAVRAIETKAVPVAARAKATGATGPRYDALSRRTSELAMQRPAVLAQLKNETAWIGDAAPVAHQEAISAAARKLDYLARMLPRGLAAATPFSAPLPPTKQQQQEWLSRAKALDNPASMLTDFTNGKLTPQAVEAVREVYPETLTSIQTQVMERLTALQSRGKAPSYLQRLQLGLLLGIPTDPLLAPNVARAIQAQYAAQPGAAQGGAAPAPGRSRKVPQLASGFRTGSDETALTSDQP